MIWKTKIQWNVMSFVFWYLLACQRHCHRCGVCASSAASAAACWHSSGPPAGQSQSSKNVDGTCPPTADWGLPVLMMKLMILELRRKTGRKRKGSVPSGPCDLSFCQVEYCPHWSWNWLYVAGRSLMGLGCEEMWNCPWREKSSEFWGYSLRSGWEDSWSLRLCTK